MLLIRLTSAIKRQVQRSAAADIAMEPTQTECWPLKVKASLNVRNLDFAPNLSGLFPAMATTD